jgi:LmbE family N-acetylglucosaminyl deacetylase
MASEQRLLAVLAHPDDETFGTGGTLGLYARRGASVHLVCATRGEVGEAPADCKGFASVAEMREAELRCAAGILGLAGVHFLGYRDSGMPGSADNRHPQAFTAQPPEAAARAVARWIRELRPQVVVTFDPIGGYNHPDHIAANRAATAAFRLAGDPSVDIDGLAPYTPQRLYYHTFPRRMLRLGVRLFRLFGRDPTRFGTNQDIDMAAVAAVDFPINARIDIRPVLSVKQQASACHSSQGGGMPSRGLAGFIFRLFGASEEFMQAAPLPPPLKVADDLYAGVDLTR